VPGITPIAGASRPRDCDVFVIGGGPAGSTAAILLAERGHRVVLADKDAHPRFHIGESLLPANVPLLDRLGVRAEIDAVGMQKWGAEFVSTLHGKCMTFQFADALDKSMPYSYQVRRSEFDEILFRRAARAGAETIENCRVLDVDLGDTGNPWCATGPTAAGPWRPRFVIDATGRDTLIANRLESLPQPSTPAPRCTRISRRAPRGRRGNISIFWFETAGSGSSRFATAPPTWARQVTYYMKSRTSRCGFFPRYPRDVRPFRAAGRSRTGRRWSHGQLLYVSAVMRGETSVMLGDAYAFIDPVFSSGVWLAMNSAVTGVGSSNAARQSRKTPGATSQRIMRTTAKRGSSA
jgi:2-polyprenyl-6-methoxyphenol hydroxylase-like FAD-dependent oxidoreductase